MARFEILGGTHVGENGNVAQFEKGRRTYVESELDLDKMFKNKFRRVDEPTKVRSDSDRADVSGGKVTDDPLLMRIKNKKLKAKAEEAARKAIEKVMEDHEPEEFEDDEDEDQFTDRSAEALAGRKKKTKLVPSDELDEEESDDDLVINTDKVDEDEESEEDDSDEEEVDLTKGAPKEKNAAASPAEGHAGGHPNSAKKQLGAKKSKVKSAKK